MTPVVALSSTDGMIFYVSLRYGRNVAIKIDGDFCFCAGGGVLKVAAAMHAAV